MGSGAAPCASSSQQRVDRIAAEARRASAGVALATATAPPRPPRLPASHNVLEQRIAEELAYARRLLDSMSARLAQDTGVLSRHTKTMQGFDIVGQMLDGLGSIVGAQDKGRAIDLIGMEDLRNRLRRSGLDLNVPRTGAELEWGAEWICGPERGQDC